VISCFSAYLICEIGRNVFAANTNSFMSGAIYGTWFFIFYIATLRIFFSRLLAELVSYLPARRYVDRLLVLKPYA
jgi:hypothetical protein